VRVACDWEQGGVLVVVEGAKGVGRGRGMYCCCYRFTTHRVLHHTPHPRSRREAMRFRRAMEDAQQQAAASAAEGERLRSRLGVLEADALEVEAFTRQRCARSLARLVWLAALPDFGRALRVIIKASTCQRPFVSSCTPNPPRTFPLFAQP